MNIDIKKLTVWALVLLAFVAGRQFFFAPPGGLYDFNLGQDQGWKLDGVYCGDTPTTLQALNGPPVWFDDTDSTNPPKQDPTGNGSGSIALPLANPLTRGAPGCTRSCAWWRIDFVSPSVENHVAWQDLKGYSVQLADSASMAANATKINAQLLVHVRKPNGSITYLRELDSAGKPVFCPLQSGWSPCKANIGTAGYTVLHLIVRIMGSCAVPAGGLEGGIYLDDAKGTK